MLTATPRQVHHPFARRSDYDLNDGQSRVGHVTYDHLAGGLGIGEFEYAIVPGAERTPWQKFWRRLAGFGADNYALEDRSGRPIAWIDMTANEIHSLRCEGRTYELRRAPKWETVIPIRALKLRATRREPILGEVDYGFASNKQIVADLPAFFPLAVQAFVIWAAIFLMHNPGVD